MYCVQHKLVKTTNVSLCVYVYVRVVVHTVQFQVDLRTKPGTVEAMLQSKSDTSL